MKQHFVIFESPGTFVHETTERPIDSWDVEKAVAMSREIIERHAAKPFAFHFTTRGRKDDELDSKVIKSSGRYFLGGRVLTLAQVKRDMPYERILIGNMEGNGWEKIVVNDNSWRSVQPLGKDDVVLDYKAIIKKATARA